MTTHWTDDARAAREKVAALLADTIGHTENGLVGERMEYATVVKRLDEGRITAAEAQERFEGILARQADYREQEKQSTNVVVVGQLGRDLVLRVADMPEVGGSSPVEHRLEMLGGKGANQAVGLRQQGAEVRLVAVAGEDDISDALLRQLFADGIDTRFIARRGESALLVDIVNPGGKRRALEHVPDSSLLTAEDILAAVSAGAYDHTDTVCLQLQQPGPAMICAAELARDRGIRVVVDGAPAPEDRARLLSRAHVVRANSAEAALLAGHALNSEEDTRDAARNILAAGPDLVVLTVDGHGEMVAWHGGSEFVPFGDDPLVDPTGAGDAFVAGLIAGLRSDLCSADAARLASQAAGHTVRRLGGRPHLQPLRSRSLA